MGLETGTYIDSLVTTNPASTDGLAQADDHLRLIKSTLKNTFPNLTGPVTATQATLNNPPSTLTDLGITDGNASGQVLTTDGSGNFSFTALPAATPDTNNYVTGGSVSGTTLTLNRQGLGSVSISGLPAAVTNNNQLVNGAGYITSQYTQPTSTGAVGTYAFLKPGKLPGQTAAGSTLSYTDYFGNAGSAAPSGTWRCNGHSTSGGGTVWLRIS